MDYTDTHQTENNKPVLSPASRSCSGKESTTDHSHTGFISSSSICGREETFTTVTIAIKPILESWRHSLFAHEWLDKNGEIKPPKDLNEKERQRRDDVEKALKNTAPLEMPVLGIGITDNIEIGSGRATLLTLAARGWKTMPAHIPKSHLKAFAQAIIHYHE